MKLDSVKIVTANVVIFVVLLLTLSGCSVAGKGISGFPGSPMAASPAVGAASGDSGSQTRQSGGTSQETSAPKSSDSTETSHKDQNNEDVLWIDVSIQNQEVKVFKGDEVIRRMKASTGVEGHETPLGTFEIQNRGLWFYNEKYKEGAKYWVSFKDWGVYLFHSVPMDKNQNVIPEEAEKLGQPASHGCIRLSIEDAKWIYDNIPEKTKVVIHQ